MDEKLASAISHWGPRFTTNGITVADFERVTRPARPMVRLVRRLVGRRRRARGARPRGARRRPHPQRRRAPVDGGDLLPLREVRLRRGLRADAHRARARRALPDDALPQLDPPGRRVEVPLDGATMVGVLRVPAGDGPHPAVLMIPGLDSTKEEFRSTEKTFLDRGLATFSVDGPGQGEAEYDLPIRGDWSAPGLAFLDALGRPAGASTATGSASGASASAATTRRASRRPPGTGSGPASRWPARTTSATAGTACRSSPGTPSGSARRSGRTTRRARTPRRWTWRGWPATITAPLLVVTGKLDRLIPWQHAERLLAARPRTPSCCCSRTATTAA